MPDLTLGIPAEKTRDLKKTMDYFKFINNRNLPVMVTIASGRNFRVNVNGFDAKSNRVYLGPSPVYDKENRIIIPIDYVISVEQILASEIDTIYKGQLTIRRGDLDDEGYKRSGLDFFQVIRHAHQHGNAIRVYLSDKRVIEGVSVGMNEQSVGIRLPQGNLIQIFYDWVERIVFI